VVLINIWAFSCLYMGHFVPALNGSCPCPPMGRDLGPNPVRYNGPCRPGTKLFRVVPCLGRAFFSVLRAGPSGPAQMYTYSPGYLWDARVAREGPESGRKRTHGKEGVREAMIRAGDCEVTLARGRPGLRGSEVRRGERREGWRLT
jgi:hypothetical protein